MCYCIQKKAVTVIAETTMYHVTKYDMLDAETTAKFGNFNKDINDQLDGTKFRIQHGGGGFTLEDEYDLQQWDPAYRENYPTEEEYGAANGGTPAG